MRFTVIVPSYNRREALALALAAWELQQPRELDFEVIVIDDGSTDGTVEMLADYRSDRFALRFDRQPNSGPSEARNRGLGMARGDFVVIVGDDIEPEPDFLAEHLQGHLELADPGSAILGLTEWARDLPQSATMRHIVGPGAQQFSYFYFEDGAEYDFRHLYTSNISLRRGLLLREREAFSSELSGRIYAYEDTELGYRLARRGLKIVYRQAALAWHHHAYEARGFFRRQQRVGEAASVLYSMLPQLKKWVDLREHDACRLRWLRESAARRARRRRVAEELDTWEARVLRLASYLDPIDPPGVDGLLWPLFRYAFLKGIALRQAPDHSADLCAAHFLELLPPAVAALSSTLQIHQIPASRADLDTVAALAA